MEIKKSIQSVERKMRVKQLKSIFSEQKYKSICWMSAESYDDEKKLKQVKSELISHFPEFDYRNNKDNFTLVSLDYDNIILLKVVDGELTACSFDRNKIASNLGSKHFGTQVKFKEITIKERSYLQKRGGPRIKRYNYYVFDIMKEMPAENNIDEIRSLAKVLTEFKDCKKNLETTELMKFLYLKTQNLLYSKIVKDVLPNIDPIIAYDELKDFEKDFNNIPLSEFVDKYCSIYESHQEEIKRIRIEKSHEAQKRFEEEQERIANEKEQAKQNKIAEINKDMKL